METILNVIVSVGVSASVGVLVWGAVLTAKHLLARLEPRRRTDPGTVSNRHEKSLHTVH